MAIKVFAPVSIGNISVGFDSLGLALQPLSGDLVGDIVAIEATNGNSQFTLTGSHANSLPQSVEDNIAWQCLQYFHEALAAKQQPIENLHLTLFKNIPVSSGLGSSGCSVVATLVALNNYYQHPFAEQQLLTLMGEMEARISGSLHYDNVAPSYLGGMQLMLPDQQLVCRSLPIFKDVYWLIAYPDVEVSTRQAREILPQQYPRSTLIEFGQTLAGFVDACHRQDKRVAFKFIRDCVAEPFREKLIPGFCEARDYLVKQGSLSAGISGSGPTLFAAFDDLALAESCQAWLQSHYLQSEAGFVHICKPDTSGARTIEQPGNKSVTAKS